MAQLFIDGKWLDGNGAAFESRHPVTQEIVWEGHSANAADVDDAVRTARKAFPAWADLAIAARENIIDRKRVV